MARTTFKDAGGPGGYLLTRHSRLRLAVATLSPTPMSELKDTLVNIHSATEVKHWIENQKRSGEFRRCGHLKQVRHQLGTGSMYSVRVLFLPWCERESWKWTIEAYGDRAAQRDILANYLGRHKVVSCPANCAFYEHETWAGWKQRFTAVWKQRRHLLATFHWFAKLPMLTQVLIVVLVIVAVARPWIPQIVTMLRALPGH